MVTMAAVAEVCAIELSETTSVADGTILANSDTSISVTVAVVNAAHVVAIEQASDASVGVVLGVVLASGGLSMLAINLEVGLRVVLMVMSIIRVGVGVGRVG
jgi:hypothetical protein